ncbi:hypothetical protein Q1W71_11750 [Flavobacterium pectinovorum]|uniref:hypothetical protein n=1 Tax=Flavobacterium pectinovorum TaxID=29533 RepID=UPI00265E3123|nr:hypothetical protein [Flavobacterium pectinovorum]WKL50419.1 hypothetical protein Q1W71_11750 [Flavobacterium pectinovorum]
MMREEEIDRITPHRAMELLRKDGIDVDADQAKIILDFFYEMAEIVVDTYLDEQKIRKFTLTQKRESKFKQSILKS